MISSNDFKTGITIIIDGNLWQVIEFLHVKPGKGAAFVRSKLRNVQTGQTIEKTFRAGEKLESAHLEKNEMQFLFTDGEECIFMNSATFEQIPIRKEVLGDSMKYLKEEMLIHVLSHGDRIIGVDLPAHVELRVVDTPPSEKGNTAQGGTKPATLETGAVVNVPFFVDVDTLIRVDTRTNQYLDRV
jgi:elongation factor P